LTSRSISLQRLSWVLLWRGALLLICLGFAIRLSLAEWHYSEAFRVSKAVLSEKELFGRNAMHLKAAGGIYPFDYRFRDAEKAGRVLESAL